eukprot:453275_1
MDVANHKQECNLMMINGRLDDNNAWIWLFTTENRAEITIKIVKFVAFYTKEPDNHASKTHKITQKDANNCESFSQNGIKPSKTAAMRYEMHGLLMNFAFCELKPTKTNTRKSTNLAAFCCC